MPLSIAARLPLSIAAPLPPSPPQQAIANRRLNTLEVDLDDLESFYKHEQEALLRSVETNTSQYLALLAEAADKIMPPPTEDDLPEDVFDVIMEQARSRRGRGIGRGAARAHGAVQ